MASEKGFVDLVDRAGVEKHGDTVLTLIGSTRVSLTEEDVGPSTHLDARAMVAPADFHRTNASVARRIVSYSSF